MKTIKQPITWYAAGRIEYSHQRFGLVHCSLDVHGGAENPSVATPVLFQVSNTVLAYSGPFTLGCDHGCAHAAVKAQATYLKGFSGAPKRSNGFGTVSHGSGLCGCIACADSGAGDVFARALDGIKKADCVFAWIADHECYGTLVELGYAHALGKQIFIAHPPEIKPQGELWFALRTGVEVGVYENAQEAWLDAICSVDHIDRHEDGSFVNDLESLGEVK